MKRKIGHLFSKAVWVLSMVSVVPVLLIGWHVLSVDSRVLQGEILDKQRTVAGQIASVVEEEVSRKAQFFSIFTDLHSDFGGHPGINKDDIDYLREKNPEITYISVLNNKGQQIFYSSNENPRFSYASELSIILRTCIDEGREYVGSVNRVNGHLYALMAFPVRATRQTDRIDGVLVAELDLAAMGHALEQTFPDDMFVSVVSQDGNLISYSGARDGLALTADTPLRLEMRHIARELNEQTGAQVQTQFGSQILVSQAHVPTLNWTVFAQQPADTVWRLLMESTFHSLVDVATILLVMAAFVVLVAALVIRPIVRPLRRLQAVAVKFEREDNWLPTEKDLIIPNNEIGRLASVFLHMAVYLQERKQALISAQQELAAINKELESRVRQRTAELEAATEELVKSERLAAIGQMASIISHEIRNPLAVISNAARLIKIIQPPSDPKLMKQFSIIEAEIKQANGIISEVLGFARSRDMILSLVDLNSYVHDLTASFPTECNIRITEELDVESARLKIDAEEIKQALRNLLSNACEAMPNGGHVRVGTRVGKKAVCIYVADDGPGIPDHLREQIFSPFFTTKARGTGLGLAVVRKAVTRHKGKLFIHSKEGEGTCFEIYLRLYQKTGDTRYG